MSSRDIANRKVSLITFADLPDLDPDDRLLKSALERRSCSVQSLVWDDRNIDWAEAGVCILRSTWDYHRKFQQFCSWIRNTAASTKLFNEPDLLLWNCKKSYLKELYEAGLPVVQTRYLNKENRAALSDLLREAGWQEAVLKPDVGLATSGVKKIDRSPASLKAAEEHLDLLLEEGEAMLQDFLPSVHYYGERSLIFIQGQYSHCVRKSAFQRLAAAGDAGEIPITATREEVEIAGSIVKYLSRQPLYARVDLVRDRQNKPLLLELELVEPSLFFKTFPAAADKMADAVVELAGWVRV